jgi:hypothetical protein
MNDVTYKKCIHDFNISVPFAVDIQQFRREENFNVSTSFFASSFILHGPEYHIYMYSVHVHVHTCTKAGGIKVPCTCTAVGVNERGKRGDEGSGTNSMTY